MQQQETKPVQRTIKTLHAAHIFCPYGTWLSPFAMNLETFKFFSTNIKACSEVPGLFIIEVEKHIHFKRL